MPRTPLFNIKRCAEIAALPKNANLPTKAAAEYVGLGRGKLLAYARAGRVKCIKLGTKSNLFQVTDLDDLIQSLKQ